MSQDSPTAFDMTLRRLLLSGQSLATVVLDYEICPDCQHVHKIRTTHTHLCPACNREIRTGRIYAPLVIYSLINLIQDLYRMELCRIDAGGEKTVERKEPRHYIGVLLLFCTLVECWMDHLLSSLMVSRRLSNADIDRNLSDNWRRSDRTDKLFKTLTGESFGNTLRHLSDKNREAGGDIDYGRVWAFAQEANKSRNHIIHDGSIYTLSNDLVEKCIENIHAVNQLFISLHNRYVAKSVDAGGR